MKECDSTHSKNTYKQQLPIFSMSSNNVRHSFAMFISPSAWNNSASVGLKFIKCDIWVFFRSLSRKFKYYYNLSRITCTLRKDQYTILVISPPVLLRMRNVSDRSCKENQNTHSVLKNFFPKNRAVYVIMWKNIVQPDRRQMTIRRMRISCWIPKVTDTHSQYVKHINFLLHKWLNEGATMLRYTYIACLVHYYHSTRTESFPY
jgi:hypothetical protein